jgi:CheY-like chemotaxis protein
MVHGFVKQSDGALRIESHEGRGTTVSLYFPRTETAEEAAQAAELSSAVAMIPESMTVLLVEDDYAVRSVTAAQLEGLGHRVIEAADARAVASACELHVIEFVVSDVTTPGADGPEAVETLRRQRPNLPVLFVTGYADRDRLLSEGVLEKPFTSAELAQAMGKAMTVAGQQASGDDFSLDRLAGRLKAASLCDLLGKWRAARRNAAPPRFDAFDLEASREPDKLIVVEVDGAHMPLRFHMAKVGAELETALGRSLTGTDLTVTVNNDLGSLEAAYRRCVRTARPVYDFSRLGLGNGAPDTFERLLTPWSTDGRTIDRLIGIAVFEGPRFGQDKQQETA